jgi:hypothetical protein
MNSTRWELWYQDTFDREAPRRVEAAGRGMKAGLRELWAHYLLEAVRAGGRRGFARFNLWLPAEGRSVAIAGAREGAARLRDWVAGERAGRSALLRQVAEVHAQLVRAGRGSEPILTAAQDAVDRASFVAWLEGYAGKDR